MRYTRVLEHSTLPHVIVKHSIRVQLLLYLINDRRALCTQHIISYRKKVPTNIAYTKYPFIRLISLAITSIVSQCVLSSTWLDRFNRKFILFYTVILLFSYGMIASTSRSYSVQIFSNFPVDLYARASSSRYLVNHKS